MKRSFAALFALLFAASCSSHDIPPTISTSQRIVNGWEAEHTDYPSIVALTSRIGGTAWCTGTAIAADVIVTAAHCVASQPPRDTYIAYGLNEPGTSSSTAAYHASHAISVHPAWKWGTHNYEAWNDIAIVLLKKPISDIASAHIIDESAHSTLLAVGNTVRIAGYGRSEQDVSSAKLHAGDVPIISVNELEMVIGADDVDGMATGACFGDSGGPAMILSGRMPLLAGVTSRDASNTGTCGRGAIYTLAGAHKDWLLNTSAQMRCSRDEDTVNDCDGPKPAYEDAGSDAEQTPTHDASNVDGDVSTDREPAGGCSASGRTPRPFYTLVLGIAALFWRRRVR